MTKPLPLHARALLALLLLIPGGASARDGADVRRNKFIPDASRLAIDDMAADMRKLILRRRGIGNAPAWGRIDHALHALLGLVPYPTDPAEVEVLEMALLCLTERAPDVGAHLGNRWHRHRAAQARGGDAH